jgi:hypothetical protein
MRNFGQVIAGPLIFAVTVILSVAGTLSRFGHSLLCALGLTASFHFAIKQAKLAAHNYHASFPALVHAAMRTADRVKEGTKVSISSVQANARAAASVAAHMASTGGSSSSEIPTSPAESASSGALDMALALLPSGVRVSSSLNSSLVVHTDNYVARVGKAAFYLKASVSNTNITYTLQTLVSSLKVWRCLLAPSQRATVVYPRFSDSGERNLNEFYVTNKSLIFPTAPGACTSNILIPLLGQSTWLSQFIENKASSAADIDSARLREYFPAPAVEAMSSSYGDYCKHFLKRMEKITTLPGENISRLLDDGHLIVCHDIGNFFSWSITFICNSCFSRNRKKSHPGPCCVSIRVLVSCC